MRVAVPEGPIIALNYRNFSFLNFCLLSKRKRKNKKKKKILFSRKISRFSLKNYFYSLRDARRQKLIEEKKKNFPAFPENFPLYRGTRTNCFYFFVFCKKFSGISRKISRFSDYFRRALSFSED